MSAVSGRARLFAAGSALVLIILVGFALLRDRDQAVETPPSATAPAPAVQPPQRVDVAPDPDPVAVAARGPKPRSLQGTDPDGGLTVADDGHFVPSRDALALFNYYLAASGEEDEAVIRRRILDEIHDRLAEPAASEAVALLDEYLGFREALRELAQAREVPVGIERRFQWLRELRRSHFGAETAEALYGEEERTLLIDLERRRVAADSALAEDERAAHLAALEAELPEAVRAARARARAPRRVHVEVDELRRSGAGEAEIFAVRERAFGWEAATRLAELDLQRSQWQERLAAYEAERSLLLASQEPASESDRRDALAALQDEHFDAAEAERVRALERLDGLSQSR